MSWELNRNAGGGFDLTFLRAVYRNDLDGVHGVDPWEDFNETFSRDDLIELRDRIDHLVNTAHDQEQRS